MARRWDTEVRSADYGVRIAEWKASGGVTPETIDVGERTKFVTGILLSNFKRK
jgi:hypothetical protein